MEHGDVSGSAGLSLASLSDEELVLRAKRKEIAAFEELIGRHEDKIYRLALRFLRSEADAQEVLQDTFLSAWRNLDSFAGQAQFGSWLYRVAANTSLMALRSRKRRPQVSTEDVSTGALDQALFESGSNWSKRPDEQFASDELRAHLQKAIDELPEPLRTVFVVRDVDELSTEETADLLGLTVPTVKTRLHRARLALRRVIGEYFHPSV